MTKTMNERALLAINNGINYLMHSGRKGQKWGVFGASGADRYQNQAAYAKTMPNPNEKEKRGLAKAFGNRSAKLQAKNDAAMENYLNNPNSNTKGARRVNMSRYIRNRVSGSVGATLGSTLGLANPALGYVGSLAGSVAMAKRSDKKRLNQLMSGYNDRVKNKNFGKMTSSELDRYKENYQKYLSKYAERTMVPYRNLSPAALSVLMTPMSTMYRVPTYNV